MGQRILITFGIVLALAAIGLGGALWRGPRPGGIDDLWRLVFGKPDLGPVDFATLRRRTTPNDALVCPVDICPRAKPDREPPIYPIPGEHLRAIVAAVAASEPRTEHVFASRWGEEDRYVARSRFWRFPDTIDAMIVGRGEGRSTLALYSRSQIGRSDLGVNRARLEHWLDRIDAAAAAEAKGRP